MNAPSAITLLRLALVPVFAGLLLYWKEGAFWRPAAAGVFTAACLTDAVDGILARRRAERTRLGALLDPLADKALLLMAYAGLAFLPNLPADARVPAWLAIVVFARDFFILAGVALLLILRGGFEPRTNFLGKATTFGQMLFVAALLWNAAPAQSALAGAVAALTLLSGASYLRTGLGLLGAAAEPPR
jgi:cardiolipin synthase